MNATTTSHTVLVVEDEESFVDALLVGLKKEGFRVEVARDGLEALDMFDRVQPDIILLDVMLPKVSGIDVCRQLRKKSQVPIIMVTAKAAEIDTVVGLEVGADDYITKPFSPRELVARINAVLRRSDPKVEGEVIDFEGLKLDPVAHRVMAGDKPVTLGPTEYRMLEFFMTHPDRVYSREQLLDRIWGGNVYVEERTIDVHIRRLRKALEEFGYDRMVQTVRGAGYRFSPRAE